MTKKILILSIAIFIAQIYLASALTIGSVSTSPEVIQPGEKVSLGINIKNNMNQDITDVVVKLNLNNAQQIIPFAPYQSSNEDKIDEINEDDNERANFDLITFSDASSGVYMIPVQATYILENGTSKEEDLGYISVTINAKPKIDVSSENSFLIKGQGGKITLKIINSGLGESKFLNVIVNSINGIKITSSSNVYVGNIDSNDFDSVDFNVIAIANAPNTISLPVEITYMDFMNNEITENKIISIKTYSQKEALSLGLIKSNNTFLIVTVIISLVVVYFIYRTIRKRRKNKKNNNGQ